MANELEQIKRKAISEPGLRFTSLYHHVTNPGTLYFCFDEEIKPGSSPGIDGVTKKKYEENLEQNIQDLSERLKRMGYRPQPVRRVYIPKAGSNQKRPLGMPTVEDKIVPGGGDEGIEPDL